MTLISCENVTFAYTPEKTVLCGVSFTLAQGTFALLTGPSGEGKSSLFRLLVRLEEPASGHICFLGTPITAIPPACLRRKIGLLGQTPTLVPGTVRHNLALPFTFAANQDLPKPTDAALEAWLTRLRLTNVALADDAQSLSPGQRQRLCLARLLLMQPAVLLLDEPASALDPASKAEVVAIVEALCQEDGIAVLQIDHSGYQPPFAYTRYTLQHGLLHHEHVQQTGQEHATLAQHKAHQEQLGVAQ